MASLLDSRRIFPIIVALGLFVMALRGMTDPDVWWHLRTGQLTIQNHAVFRTDPYSFTGYGRPWVNHEWLFDICLFSLYRVAGTGGLIVAFAAVVSASFMLAFRRSSQAPLTGLIIVVAALASSPLWGIRPQMVSLLLASLLLLIRDRSRNHPERFWWALPLMFIWVNLHGGYALGIALLILFIAGDLLEVAFGTTLWPVALPRLRVLAAVILGSLAVVPLNPYGTKMYAYPLSTLTSSSMQSFIVEWFSPNFHDTSYRLLLLLILLTITVVTFSSKRLREGELLLLLFTMAAALISVRHIPIFALVAAFSISQLTQPSPEHLRSAQVPSRTKPVLNGALLLLVVIVTVAQIIRVVRHEGETEARNFPLDAVSFISQKRPPGPIFNHYNWGGYLIWKLYPEYRVYIDGRADVYGDSLMHEFGNVYYLHGDWKDPLQHWGIRTVVLPSGAPLLTILETRGHWTRLYSDLGVVILTKPPRSGSTISN